MSYLRRALGEGDGAATSAPGDGETDGDAPGEGAVTTAGSVEIAGFSGTRTSM